MSNFKYGIGSSAWEAAIRNKTINIALGTEQAKSAILERRVIAVRLQVNAPPGQGQSSGEKVPAHFRIFLVLSDARKVSDSVELNSTTDQHRVNKPVDPLCPQLVVRFCPKREFSSAAGISGNLTEETERIVLHRRVTVEEVLALLLEKGRDRYRLDRNTGSGCRFWCQTVLRDMVDKGWLAKEADQQVNVMVSEKLAGIEWAHVDLPKDPLQGTFYDPPRYEMQTQTWVSTDSALTLLISD